MDEKTFYTLQNCNLRGCPGTDYDKVGSLTYAQEIVCNGKVEDGDKEWDDAGTRERVGQAFFEMNRLFVERHVPVILTEFGCVDKGNTKERLAWTSYYMEQSRRYGIWCIWWDCGGYALLDRENKSWRFPEIVEELTDEQK